MDATISKFLIDLSQNEELKKEFLAELGEQATEATETLNKLFTTFAEFASEKGYEIDESNLINNTLKVDDEALEEVAGGRLYLCDDGKIHGDCGCFAGGGGVADEYQKTCACVFLGGGDLTPAGKELFKKVTNQSIVTALACCGIGSAS